MTSVTELAESIASQFKDVGYCYLDSDHNVRFSVELPDDPGVYAFTVGDKIHYVGSAQNGIRRRFQKYIRLSNKGTVATWLRANIADALRSGKDVRVLTAARVPMSWNGLPIDHAPGLESGLIRALQPAWNRKGKGKMKEENSN